jgi:non-specific serine/threonine protein kinase
LLNHLRQATLLLVLDNCEHVIGACAHLAEMLLRECPGVGILATSRETLEIPGETRFAVPPLSAPDVPHELAPELIAKHDAVTLFVERAQAEPSVVLTPPVLGAVAEICRRLDGIPLAIELAAARVGVLSPAQIAARLGNRFNLLTGGARTAPHRHQTLLAALDWSYDLLSRPERTLLWRLSVFIGGWTLDAAEEVCGGEDLDSHEVLGFLARLAAKSLVVCDMAGEEVRYRLLDTIRAYGREKLESAGEEAPVRRAHAGWCRGLTARAERELTGRNQAAWLDRLEAELPQHTRRTRVEHGKRRR